MFSAYGAGSLRRRARTAALAITCAAAVAAAHAPGALASGCTDNFTGASPGSWQLASNWTSASDASVHQVPAAGDVACWGSGVTVDTSSAANAAAIEAPGGTLELDAGGSSLLTLGSAITSSIGNLNVLGGSLDGPATLDVSGNILWTGGELAYSSLHPVSIDQTGAGTFQISCPSLTQPILNNSSITTTAAIDLTCQNFAAIAAGSPTTLTTTSTVHLGNGVVISGAGHATLTTAGLSLDAGASTVYGLGPFGLVLTGGTTVVPAGDTLHDSSGLTLQGGALQADGTVSPGQTTLTGGTLDGSGYLVSIANNGGNVIPGDPPAIGTLTAGSFSQAAGGSLTIPIQAAGAASSLSVQGGPADLGGTLELHPVGGYTSSAVPGDAFNVVSDLMGSMNGTFATTTTTPSLQGGSSFDVNVANGNATATVHGTAAVNTVLPLITGSTVQGDTVTTTNGSWNGNPTVFTYQWEDCPAGAATVTLACSQIAGATAPSYTLTASDVGQEIAVAVTAHAGAGPVSADALPLGPVQPLAQPTTTTPTTTTPTTTTTTPTTTTTTTTTSPTGAPSPTAPATSSSPTPAATAPTDTAAPSVAGSTVPGSTVRCSNGTWNGNPTTFTYQWRRNGSPILGAGASSYTVQILDEADQLACTVVAGNGAGSSAPATSPGVLVAIPGTLNCPRPSGTLSPTRIGLLALGESKVAARRALARYRVTHYGFDDFCLYAGWGIRGVYRADRVVLLLTANPFYSLQGVTPGVTIASVAKRLRVGREDVVGRNDWYFAAGARSTYVFKVRRGVIQEIGIADPKDTGTPSRQRAFISSFRAA